MDALLASMSYRDLLEWQAYESIEPFGRRRSDVHAAMIVQAIKNVLVTEEKNAVSLEEVFPRFGESTREREALEKEKAQQATEKVQDLLGK